MALEKTIQLDGEISLTDAYHKVIQIDINDLGQAGRVVVAIYKDKSTRDANENNYVKTIGFNFGKDIYPTYFAQTVFEASKTNPKERAYLYLKTLDNYSDVKDI